MIEAEASTIQKVIQKKKIFNLCFCSHCFFVQKSIIEWAMLNRAPIHSHSLPSFSINEHQDKIQMLSFLNQY